MSEVLRGINWNNPEDQFDVDVFDQLVSQLWIPERFPIAQDLKSWGKFTEEERLLTMRVFTGLTVLDSLQGNLGAVSLLADAQTDIERSWLSNIIYMEHIHAKSYSNIFMTLSNTKEINDSFRWSEENDYLQYKANVCAKFYRGEGYTRNTPENFFGTVVQAKRKVASVLLESFLFYSGFYLPLYWQSQGKLTNCADMIKAIIRDEAIHGQAIGYKYQRLIASMAPALQEAMKDFAYDLLSDLYENEVKYTQELYDSVGLTEDVKKFLRYNGNRALQNLGYENLFAFEEVNPAILNAMSLSAVTGDFFSATNSYGMATVEEIDESDFDF